MANLSSLPLFEKVNLRNRKSQAVEILLLFLLFSLLSYHFLSLKLYGIPAFLAFLCESCFTLIWILVVNVKWNQIKYVQYPDRLLKQKTDLPAVDMFVTTADAELEPPILTMNTVISLLAVDYPVGKLACYLSDDGASPLTYYALVETSQFAKIWLPFCKKHNINIRTPFQYFATFSIPSQEYSFEFQQEWKMVKDKYEMLCQKIEDASKTCVRCEDFPEMDKKNHPAIVKLLGHGLAGIQGPMYMGTNCFHRRKVIYGVSPDQKIKTGKLSDLDLQRKFGKSSMLKKSGAHILSESASHKGALSSFVEAAHHVIGCDYEHGTCWGTEVGYKYGSQAEDALTGLGIQGKGWRSMYCTTDPASFLGCAASSGPATMIQTKRWATGLLEILLSTKSPILATINGNLQFRQCLAYVWILSWGLRSIPELVYSLLPAYCIITDSRLLPKVYEPAILIPVSLFLIYNIYTLSEYLTIGLSTRAWWNNQRIARIKCTSPWLFANFTIILKLLGLSQSAFVLTAKNPTTNDDEDQQNKDYGKFTFNESLMFVPGTTILLVNLTALVIGMVGSLRTTPNRNEVGVGELLCSFWVVLYFWIFLKGLFGKGIYGIPLPTILKSGVLVLMFVHFCKWSEKA